MSKIIKVQNGDFKVSVSEGAEIILDAPDDGRVVVTGDLQVQGTQTVLESTDLAVKDNIIIVNDGETGDGVSLGTAGLRVDRGNLLDTYFVFDENINWLDTSGQSQTGAFVVKDDTGSLVGLRTNSITTGGGNLNLINSGSGIVSVTGTVDYEERIFEYDLSGNITGNVIDDDHIPNTKSIVDYIAFSFDNVFLSQIGDGEDTVSSIVIRDRETTGVDSIITINIDEKNVGSIFEDRFEFNNIRLSNTTIETIASNEDLILSAPGIGSVRINDTLHINTVPGIDDLTLDPLSPEDGIKLYVADEKTGKTGLYYTNSNGTRDEIVSKNRSLLFSMLF